ncbi:MAG: hypothetical protein KC636_05775, partial [Myxococcales bacterium]|nr:hypothetical protein [Myxococcales bacterium]
MSVSIRPAVVGSKGAWALCSASLVVALACGDDTTGTDSGTASNTQGTTNATETTAGSDPTTSGSESET